MALLGAVLVVVFGSSVVDHVQGQNHKQTAQLIIQEIDSRFSTLSQMNDVSRVDFTIGDTDPDSMRVVRGGSVTVTVNRNGTCSASVPLSSMRYENKAGDTVAYEAGGVWRQSAATASTMVTAPDMNFRNGSLALTVVNISGTVQDSYNEAVIDTASSQNQSHKLKGQVLQGSCIRPDNMTVKVSSDYYKAWGDYMGTEFGVDARTFDSNSTALVFIPQNKLPPETDDDINSVVNLSRKPSGAAKADYMKDVTISDQNITVDKDPAHDRYIVTVKPLGNHYPQIGKIKKIVEPQKVYRDPMDVVFIMDVSGSMSYTSSTPGLTKSQAAQVGAASFVSELNGSFDRGGLVTYENYNDIRTANNGSYLESTKGSWLTDSSTSGCSHDFSASSINNTICHIDDNPGGGTRVWLGIQANNKLFDLTSNQTRNKIAVLLTDGKNNKCQYGGSGTQDCKDQNEKTVDAAKAANRSGITIYTIGYGSNVAEDLLKDVANATGGQYYQTTNADQLKQIFEDIARKAKEKRIIARQPLSTNVSSGSEVHAPFIPGDTDTIANRTTASGTFMNVNDPTAPSLFRHRFSLQGGDSVEINATWYGCKKWKTTPYSGGGNNQSYNIARCAELDTSDVHYLQKHDVSIYTNGEDISSELTNNSAWWQTNMTNTLVDAGALDDVHDTTLNLSSNQAVAILDFSIPGAPFDNRMALLYDVGLSESEARPEDVVNIRVRNVHLND
ncbi:MAG: VWA domain-containing protein [Halorientalis sp.]